MNSEADEMWMRRCLQLARLGIGNVQPNPMVGAVIVHDNRIVGEGWHRKCGEAHAEINAIHAVKDPSLLAQSTLYVNLEPCSHFGKTPPCVDELIRRKIPRVVIGTVDTNAKVNGNGIRKLKDAGVQVVVDVLAEECRELNRRFFTYHNLQRPYIILKWAQTADGYMDVDRDNNGEKKKYWITNPELNVINHKWRSEEDAIAVGYNTYLNDSPQLTNRLFAGKSPRRFIIGRFEEKTVIPGFMLLPDDLPKAMQLLYDDKIQSLIVEGGRKTLDAFIKMNLWDEVRILSGNQKWGSGTEAPVLPVAYDSSTIINRNVIYYVRRHL